MSSPVPYLSPAQLQAAVSIRDLSDPGEGPHAIQILIDQAVEALSRARGRRTSGRIRARRRAPREPARERRLAHGR